MPQPDPRYWAFISYSHQDEAWARWLHQRIETWRVPRRLVGGPHPDGTIPRRLLPVFRDRDELASSAELGAVINRALAESRYQIVICSPRSAASRWVNEEIRYFKSLGREARMLALIVEGEPHATEIAQECFAPALKWRVLADGSLGDEPVEPIAADARVGRDGRDGALLKLLAGILNVGYDELVQRERRRRLWDRVRMVGAAAAVVAVIAGAWIAFDRYKTEQALQYRIAELYQSGRRELLAHNEARAAVLLNEVYKLGVDTPALRYMLGRAMRVVDAQQLRFETGSPVLGVQLSPGERHLYTIGADWHLRLWDLVGAKKLADVALGDVTELGATYSPQGSLISIETDHDTAPKHRLRVFDAFTGELKLQLETAEKTGEAVLQRIDAREHFLTYLRPDRSLAWIDLRSGAEFSVDGRFTVSTFCADGRSLLVGREDGAILRTDLTTAPAGRIYAGPVSPVTAITSSLDCMALAAGTADGTFRVWDAESGAPRMIGGLRGSINHLQLSADGSRLMSTTPGSASLWNTRNGALIYNSKFLDPLSAVADSSPDGVTLAVRQNSHLALVDPQSGDEMYSLDAHLGAAQAFDFGDEGRSFVSAGADGSVTLWRLPEASLADLLQSDVAMSASEAGAGAIAFNPGGDRLFVGGGDRIGTVWDSKTRTPLFAAGAHAAPIKAAAFSTDRRWLATGGGDAIQLWDAQTGATLRRIVDAGEVLRLDFNPEKPLLAAQILGARTRIWDATSAKLIADLQRDEARAGAFSPEGSAYTYGLHGVVISFDLSSGKRHWSVALAADNAIDPGVGVIAYSRDGRRMLATLTSRWAWILDSRDGRVLSQLRDPSSSYFNEAEFSPDGHSVLLADSAKQAKIWEPATGRILTLGDQSAAVRTARFSADGTLILTAGDDGMMRIWDARRGDLLAAFTAHEGSIANGRALFSPDGRTILTAGTDHRARLWSVLKEARDPQQLDSILRCRVAWQVHGTSLKPAPIDAARCSTSAAPAILPQRG